MKRIVSLIVFLVLVAIPSIAFAGEKTGVYVAPKLITGWTQMNGVRGVDEDGDIIMKMKKTKETIGGGLAIGYDFYRQFQVPVRMEIEYAAFSATKGKKNRNFFENETGKEADKDREYDSIKESMSGSVQAQTLFLNSYYDFHNSSKFTPYVGAGLGVAFLKAKGRDNVTTTHMKEVAAGGSFEKDKTTNDFVSYGSNATTNLAWNVGAGVAYDITETLSIDLGYRFAALGKAKTRKNDGEFVKATNVNMHQVALGLRFTF